MIQTFEDLLKILIEREKVNMEKFNNIKHPSTIGDMYEGLSKKLLKQSIFRGLNLNIRDGFVRNNEGKLSKQIDSMIVIGEGENIQNTTHYIYDFENVIAVLESKKILYSDQLGSSYENIMSFNDVFYPTDTTITMFDIKRAFQQLTKTVLKEPIANNSEMNQMLFHVLVVMFAMPLRIIFGYEGFNDQKKFRDSYYQYLSGKTGNKGYGINSFPDLIICNNYSIVKSNFQPFETEMTDGEFPFLFSGVENPLHYFIAMIWAKLQIRFNLPAEIWGDDDAFDNGYIFLNAKLNMEKLCWEYKCIDISSDELSKRHEKNFFEPIAVDVTVFTIANKICTCEKIDLGEMGYKDEELEKIKKKLLDTKYFEINGDIAQAITMSMMCVIHPQKGFLIGENIDGEFSRWLAKNMSIA